MKTSHQIKIKTPEEIDILRKAGKILSSIIKDLERSLTAGVTKKQIDQKAESLILAHNVRSAFKGYRGFPGCACISVNQEVVHGVPNGYVLKDGDIVSLDVGIVYQNYYSDTATTVAIGAIDPFKQKLMDVTKNALYLGIQQALPENRLSDISFTIQQYVESHGFSVVRNFVGHGIGQQLHEEPEIPNFGPAHQGPVLAEGMVLAIEPMVNIGTHHTKIGSDGWTVVTEDGKPSAHFEHTIVIMSSGPEILTA